MFPSRRKWQEQFTDNPVSRELQLQRANLQLFDYFRVGDKNEAAGAAIAAAVAGE
jgi:hypothetical protein